MTSSLAWPIAAVVTVLVFRAKIAEILDRPNLREVRAGPVSVHLSEEIEAASDELAAAVDPAAVEAAEGDTSRMGDLYDVAASVPEAALLAGYARLELALRRALKPAANGTRRYPTGSKMIAMAHEEGLIDNELAEALTKVNHVRNHVAHGMGAVSTSVARGFLDTVTAAIRQIERGATSARTS